MRRDICEVEVIALVDAARVAHRDAGLPDPFRPSTREPYVLINSDIRPRKERGRLSSIEDRPHAASSPPRSIFRDPRKHPKSSTLRRDEHPLVAPS